MRELSQYRMRSWLSLEPVKDAFKQFRNDIILKNYLSKGDTVDEEVAKKYQCEKTLVVSIAFNSPVVIAYLIEYFVMHVKNAQLIIADNSNNDRDRQSIKKLCQEQGIDYISLPPSKIRHANRSHSLAMQWCYEKIIAPIKPTVFGFIDHDLIPLVDIEIQDRLGDQAFYGAKWNSDKTNAWQLWAGYCFFNYKKVSPYHLNFLYDFSNGLDTGGRNYHRLYRHYSSSKYRHGLDQFLDGEIEGETYSFNRIDNDWLHLGGAGYRQDFSKADLAEKMQKMLVILSKHPLNKLDDTHDLQLTTKHT